MTSTLRMAMTAAILAGMAMGLSACHTVDGVKEDATIAGQATSKAADNAGQAIGTAADNTGKAISNTAESVKQGL